MRKVVRALCYLKELCLMAFFKLFGAVCRCCSAKYRELWLVCERGNDARDNGYWFYRYLKEDVFNKRKASGNQCALCDRDRQC